MTKQWTCCERHIDTGQRAIGAGPARYWRPGQTITISFSDGREIVHQFVRDTAKRWIRYANLKFEWLSANYNTMIRIAFRTDTGSWSYIGTDNLLIPARGDEASQTMNFGWLDFLLAENRMLEAEGLVLHEFGHMIGMLHEQNHPENIIAWDEDKINQMVFDGLTTWEDFNAHYNFKIPSALPVVDYDRHSVMHYPTDERMLKDGAPSVGINSGISEGDQWWAFQAYPPRTLG